MSDDEIELNAQLRLQEFDDAIENPASDLQDLGRKAVAALDASIAHWKDKSYMQETGISEGGHEALRQYAQRQIEWAANEKARVLNLITR